MSPLERMVRLREAVTGLCAAIDSGEVIPTEHEMMAMALVVEQHGGMLKHDLLCQLASRCKNGRAVLDRMAH